MSEDWDTKLVIGSKRQVAKVTKKDSDLNGAYACTPTFPAFFKNFRLAVRPSDTFEWAELTLHNRPGEPAPS